MARAANSKNRQIRLQAQIDRRNPEIALLQEELRFKDARVKLVMRYFSSSPILTMM